MTQARGNSRDHRLKLRCTSKDGIVSRAPLRVIWDVRLTPGFGQVEPKWLKRCWPRGRSVLHFSGAPLCVSTVVLLCVTDRRPPEQSVK